MKLRDCIVAFISALVIIVLADLAGWDKQNVIILWLIYLIVRDEIKKDEK